MPDITQHKDGISYEQSQTSHTTVVDPTPNAEPSAFVDSFSKSLDALMDGNSPAPQTEKKEPEVKEVENEETKPDIALEKKEKENKEPAKVEEKKEDAVEQKGETKPEDGLRVEKKDDTEELEKAIENPKNKTERRINHLLKRLAEETGKRTTTEKTASEKEAKIAELSKQITDLNEKSKQPSEDVQKQLDELLQYRRHYELEGSDEVKTRFDKPREDAESRITELLKQNGSSDANIEYIRKLGGFAAFSKSRVTHDYGDGNVLSDSQIAKNWLGNMDPADSAEITAMLQKQALLNADRKNYIDTEKGKAKEYFTKLEESRKAQTTSQSRGLQEGKALLERWYNKAVTEVEFLKDIPVDEKLGDAAKKQAIEENTERAKWRSILQNTLQLDGSTREGLQAIVDAALDSVARYHWERKATILEKQLSELKAENEKLKNAGTTIPKGKVSTPPGTVIKDSRTPKSSEDIWNEAQRNFESQ